MFIKHLSAMVVGVGLLTALAPFREEGAEQGKRIFEKDCRACHVVPDPSIRADKIWIDLLSSTAWSGTAGDRESPGRKALATYLSAKDAQRPVKIDAAFEKNPAVAYGTVSVNFESGSVALIPKGGGGGVRLVWEKSAKTKNLPVPEGTYRVSGYRIEREQKGEIWTLCASGNHGPEVTIAKGKNVALKPDGRVRIQSDAKPRHGISVNVKLTDENHLGVVALKGSERTAAAFEALDGGGKAIHQGTLAYG